MSKNTILHKTSGGDVVIAAAVAAGVVGGDIVLLGANGLFGYALTDRFVAANYGTEVLATPPQGLADGEASVELPGITRTVDLTVAGAPALGDPVYRVAADGTYSTTATGNLFIGWYLGSKYGVGLASGGAV